MFRTQKARGSDGKNELFVASDSSKTPTVPSNVRLNTRSVMVQTHAGDLHVTGNAHVSVADLFPSTPSHLVISSCARVGLRSGEEVAFGAA